MVNALLTTSAAGMNLLQSAITGTTINVNRYHLMAAGAVNIQFFSNSTPISGIKFLNGAGTGAAGGYDEIGHFQTNPGEALYINLSAAVEVSLDYTVNFNAGLGYIK